MSGAEAQAKQLDSVTDVVQEQEVDAGKAQQAISDLSVTEKKGTPDPVAPAITIFKEDVSALLSALLFVSNPRLLFFFFHRLI